MMWSDANIPLPRIELVKPCFFQVKMVKNLTTSCCFLILFAAEEVPLMPYLCLLLTFSEPVATTERAEKHRGRGNLKKGKCMIRREMREEQQKIRGGRSALKDVDMAEQRD